MELVDSQNPVVDWQQVRADYPAASAGVFLNAGARGAISVGTHKAVEDALRAEVAVVSAQPGLPIQLAETRVLGARLLKAPPDTVAVTKNTSDGLNGVAAGLDWRPGDNVITCSAVEHANNVYLWMNLAQRGIEIRDIPTRDGTVDAARMAEAIDERTRLVTICAVSFVPGFRTDMATIGRACREHDVLFLVDGVQACGIVDLDVVSAGISALATSTSKGLLGMRGLGLLYVDPDWIERLQPVYIARNSIDTHGNHYSGFEGNDSSLYANARRFECGTYNYLGIAAARNALTEILALGTGRIEARATGLATTLAEGLAELGLPLLTPSDDAAQTHLVTVGQRGMGDATTTGVPLLDRIAEALSADGVQFSIRRGLLRFGFNFYNDETDVARVLDIARKTIRES